MDWARAAASLDAWFAQHARDLPWRRDPSPYNVVLSEFILQQTRMEVGLRFYERIRKRFPSLGALARARESSVLAAWSGLGYYSRAWNLHRTAKRIQHEFGGVVPKDPRVLQSLPGVGPYTAGAIASIAYDERVPSLDGNQFRVFARLLGLPGPSSAAQRRTIHDAAMGLLRNGSPRRLNQALMDLGSSICTPTPDCPACPLLAQCATRGGARRGRSKPRPRLEHWRAILHVRAGRVWLRRPTGNGLLGTRWLPPLERLRAPGRGGLEHVFSHRRWRVETVRSDAGPVGEGRWVAPKDLARLPHSSLTRRLMEEALDGR